MSGQFGYYTDPEQTEPVHDPGIAINCLGCHKTLTEGPLVTISLLVVGDTRSYFYRLHKACEESMTDEQKQSIDSIIVDAVASTRNTN